MEFRETAQSDLDFVADNSISRGVFKHQPEQVSFCYTLEHEGNILGVGGFQLINAHTAWCWTDWTHLAGKHLIAGYRLMRDLIDTFAKEHNIKRLQAYVESDFSEGITMVQHLGFKKESIMKNFVGDKDAFMYARVL